MHIYPLGQCRSKQFSRGGALLVLILRILHTSQHIPRWPTSAALRQNEDKLIPGSAFLLFPFIFFQTMPGDGSASKQTMVQCFVR